MSHRSRRRSVYTVFPVRIYVNSSRILKSYVYNSPRAAVLCNRHKLLCTVYVCEMHVYCKHYFVLSSVCHRCVNIDPRSRSTVVYVGTGGYCFLRRLLYSRFFFAAFLNREKKHFGFIFGELEFIYLFSYLPPGSWLISEAYDLGIDLPNRGVNVRQTTVVFKIYFWKTFTKM